MSEREFNEELAYEEWWDASRKPPGRPCPACFDVVEDPDAICCESCLEEFDADDR